MYFAICWKNKQISLEELNIVKPKNIKFYNNSFLVFDIDGDEKLLYQLWWIIKRGKVVTLEDLKELLQDVKIIWTNDKWLWDIIKAEKIVRRYKIVSMQHADLEIKQKWKELIRIWSIIGLVMWYQNIWLYEDIDFGKPARSMQMWMMPAKLTHILINIALKSPLLKGVATKEPGDLYTIYDPFVWSWTTGFLANFMWFDFLWSDKNIDYVKKNYRRRQTRKRNQANKVFEIFEQDIFNPLNIKEKHLESMLIVTEWRLWNIVTKNTGTFEIKNFQIEVSKFYQTFLSQIANLFKSKELKLPTMVFTIPYYINKNNFLESDLKDFAAKLWRNFSSVDEIYQREWQNVGRKIIICKP